MTVKHWSQTEYVGVDYGIRRLAWARLDRDGLLLEVDELRLPGGEFLDGLPAMIEYMDMYLLPWLSERTTVAIEAPITGASNNRRVAAQMAIVAGCIYTRTTVVAQAVFLEPSTWKKAALGKGNATKEDVAAFSTEYGKFMSLPSQDVADALAIAVACQRIKEELG